MGDVAIDGTPYKSVYAHRGLHYLAFLRLLHEYLRPEVYLEIGVNKGDALVISNCASIGIDPNFLVSQNVIGKKPSLFLFQKTSDECFTDHDLLAVAGRPVDLAFLDGMHHAEFLLRDFMNVEKIATRNSVIVLHDCLPTDVYMTRRGQFDAEIRAQTPSPASWTGDVWKTLSALREYRPDLRIVCVAAPPTGLVLVSNLDPQSRRIDEAYDEMLQRFDSVTVTHDLLSSFLAAQSIVSTEALDTEPKLREALGLE